MKKRKETNKIIIHCSATPPDRNVDAEEIRRWHKNKGWGDIGYHYVITRDGWLEEGRDIDLQGSHVKGENHDSLGICLVGGVDEKGKPQFNFTKKQMECLSGVVGYLKVSYSITRVEGHNKYSSKKCPCFDVGEYFK